MWIQSEKFLNDDAALVSRSDVIDRLGCELMSEALRAGREVRLRVIGSSMLPAVWPHDILKVRPLDDTPPAKGELLVFTRYGRLFAHRIVRRFEVNGATQLITRGDASSICDPPIMSSEILGSVVAIVRGERAIPANPMTRVLPMRLLSFAIRHSNLCRRVILKIHSMLRPVTRTPATN